MKQIVIEWSGNIRGEGAAHPDGRFAVSVPGVGVVIQTGEILPEPHGPARFIDIPDSGIGMGCNGQNDPPVAYEWDGATWNARGTAWGPNAVCYKGDQFYAIQSKAEFAATGGYRAFINGTLQTCDETHERHGLFDCTDFGDVCIGQLDDDRYGGGVGVRFADDGVLRRVVFERLEATGSLREIVVKRAGDQFAITPVDEHRHITPITWASADELRAMAQARQVLSFAFTHPVLIAPFKDAEHQSGATYRIDGGSLGVYTEDADPAAIFQANPHTRVLFAHDAPTVWTLPVGARPFDLPLIEYYRLTTETLTESVSRWHANTTRLIAEWPCDIGVIPMFYCQGGAAGSSNPPEVWTVDDVLDGLRALSALVNLSPRIKVIAPFAYNRANGITAHPELMQAWRALLAAGSTHVDLVPVATEPPPIVIPPIIQPPTEEPTVADLTPEQKNEVCDAIGAVAAAAFKKDPASMSQGVRQAIDQNVTDVATLILLAQAREGGATPQAVERAAAAGRLLQGR